MDILHLIDRLEEMLNEARPLARVVTQGQAAGLELRAQNGQVTLVRLAFQENLVHIDGGKVYRTAAEVCQ